MHLEASASIARTVLIALLATAAGCEAIAFVPLRVADLATRSYRNVTFHIVDDQTGLPITDATVRVAYGNGYDQPDDLTANVDDRGEVKCRLLVDWYWSMSVQATGYGDGPVVLPKDVWQNPPKKIEVRLAPREAASPSSVERR